MLDAKLIKLATQIQPQTRSRLALGIDALDEQLGGGIPKGAVTEIVSSPGHDGWWPALRVLAQAEGVCGVLNHDDSFYPPGVALMGVDLARLLIVRPNHRKDALWALERMARTPGLDATFAWLPDLRDVELRRLQLAAERTGQAVLLARDENDIGRASWGAMRLGIYAERGDEHVRRLRIEVLRMRGGRQNRAVRIEVEHGTGVVRSAAVVSHGADYAKPRYTAGA